MNRLAIVLLLLAQAGCTAVLSTGAAAPSACAGGAEASYACQVERYRNINVE